MQFIDLTGQRFNKLTVIRRGQNVGKQTAWICKCDCGNVKTVTAAKLKNGNTKSCGCYRSRYVSRKNYKHGSGNSCNKIYNLWVHIKQRCNNPNFKQFKDYGGRGIKICTEWQNDFMAFSDYVIKLPNYNTPGFNSLDRINNNGNYEPGNVRWATSIIQNNNRRNNKHLGATNEII